MGRRALTGGVSALGHDRIQFDFVYDGKRWRPTLPRVPNEANLKRARKQLEDIKRRITEGTFNFREEFPNYRFQKQLDQQAKAPTSCNDVFDAFLKHCSVRVGMKDLAFATYNGYRKLLAQIWRPKIGEETFLNVRYTQLAAVVSGHVWSKKTYNNAVSTIRCAFDFGYRDTPDRPNPAKLLTCLRIAKKDRPKVDPFTLDDAEAIIAGVHADWGEAIGNFDEFRFFSGLRLSEQIALEVSDVDLVRGILHVTKARVLRRDKDRTKTGVDREVELCPRALDVVKRQLQLRADYVAAGKLRHRHLFFLENGTLISDPEVTRRRWNETLDKLPHIRRRGPYHARHSFVTWNLMIGKNPLWVADQHGHGVQVMLTMYAAWLRGATDADIERIREALQSRRRTPDTPEAPAHVGPVVAEQHAKSDENGPPQSPEFDTPPAPIEAEPRRGAKRRRQEQSKSWYESKHLIDLNRRRSSGIVAPFSWLSRAVWGRPLTTCKRRSLADGRPALVATLQAT